MKTQGAGSNYKNLPLSMVEPPGQGIGRSRGGLSTKIHHAVDGHGRPLAIVVTGGQRNDGAMLERLMADIRVPRIDGGRPRTRPDAVLADKAYAAGVIRMALRERGIRIVIPEQSDQIAARKKRGYRGGRPPSFDALVEKRRNVVERSFARNKQWRAIATPTTNSPSLTAPEPSLTPASRGRRTHPLGDLANHGGDMAKRVVGVFVAQRPCGHVFSKSLLNGDHHVEQCRNPDP